MGVNVENGLPTVAIRIQDYPISAVMDPLVPGYVPGK
jgi:hypothetical protein